MQLNSKIYVAGHAGLVGSAIIRELYRCDYKNIITRNVDELDLRNQLATEMFFELEKPDYVFLAAAKVGGILANSTYKADFIYDNLMIAANVIHASYKFGVKKLLNLGSSCIYPKNAPQPLKEEYLLTSELEQTNEPYALAKITAIKLCRYYNEQYGTNFISVMPTNLYGPNDNFNLETAHVLPAIMRKMHEAKARDDEQIVLWGTGEPRREFLHAYDLANAIVFLMQNFDAKQICEFVNIGCGQDLTIKELADVIKDIVEFEGQIVFDPTKPDGTPRKLLDVSKINALGWCPKINLHDGIRSVYELYVHKNAKRVNNNAFYVRV